VHADNAIDVVDRNNNVMRFNEPSYGTVDLSGGHDWSGGNSETFTLSLNGASAETITLDANCANLAAVVVEIQAAIDAVFTSSEFTVSSIGGDHIKLVVESGSYFSYGAGAALVTIGWTASYNYGDKYLFIDIRGIDNGVHSCPVYTFNVAHQTESMVFDCTFNDDTMFGYNETEDEPVAAGVAQGIVGEGFDAEVEYFEDAAEDWTLVQFEIDAAAGGGYVIGLAETDDQGEYPFVYAETEVAGNKFLYIANAAGSSSVQINGWHQCYNGRYNSSDGYYYFVYVNTTNDVKKAKFKNTVEGIVDVETLSVTKPAVFNHKQQQYWFQGNVEWLIDQDHFYVRVNAGTWFSYSGNGESQTTLVWSIVNGILEVNYVAWKDTIYFVNQQGFPLKIQELVDDSYVGFDDWLNDGTDTIYQVAFSTYAVGIAEFTSQLQDPYKARIETYTEPFEDQWLLLYDDSEVILGIYKVNSYIKESGYYKLNLSGGDEIDLKVEEDSSYTTKDVPDMLTDEIDNYCAFFYQNGNISVVPATTYDKEFKNKNLANKFRWFQSAEGYIISWTPDYNIYYDQFSASGKTIQDSNVLEEPKHKTESLKYSKIVVYGGFLNGTRLESVKYGEPNFGTYYDWFAEIIDQTELDAIAAQIETDRNLKLQKIQLKTHGHGFIRAGTSVTLTLSQYSIAAETWYVVYSKYDELTDICELMITDAVYIPAVNENTETQVRIQTNQQNIGQAQDLLGTMMMLGTSNSAFVPCVLGSSSSVMKFEVNTTACANVDGTDFYSTWFLPCPTNLGTKKLYIASAKVSLNAADATDFVSAMLLIGFSAAGVRTIEVNDGTNQQPAGEYNYAFTDVDASGYISIVVYIYGEVFTQHDLEIAAVSLECYYDD